VSHGHDRREVMKYRLSELYAFEAATLRLAREKQAQDLVSLFMAVNCDGKAINKEVQRLLG
jgi:hypothetical protein